MTETDSGWNARNASADKRNRPSEPDRAYFETSAAAAGFWSIRCVVVTLTIAPAIGEPSSRTTTPEIPKALGAWKLDDRRDARKVDTPTRIIATGTIDLIRLD